MSQLRFMERLLEGVEVEWKSLGKICSIGVGQAPKGINDGKYSFVNAGTTPSGYLADYNTEAETITTPSRGQGGIGYIGYQSNPFWCGPLCYRISSINRKVITRFVYYVMANRTKDVISLANMTGVPALNKKALSEFEIPIPPLEVQSEIVRILDNFTELTAELTAELSARKKQYNYYRDKLLSFEEGEVEWKKLGEIFNLKNGYTPSKSNQEYWNNGNVPWFRMDDIRKNGRILDNSLQKVSDSAIKAGKLFPANSIIISTSATIGEHALITVPYLCNQRFTNLSLKEEYIQKFNIKFLFYYAFVLDEWCKNNTTKSSFSSVDMNGFKNFPIPIPPLEKQKEIVAILDKFDTLTHSISEGLPKEIALRQKQYKYYRDLLLSFSKPEEVKA